MKQRSHSCDKQRTNESEPIHAHQMNVLVKVANILIQPRDFEQKCEDVIRVIFQAAEADLVALWQASQDGLALATSIGASKPKSASFLDVKKIDALATGVFERGREVVANDYSQQPDASSEIIEMGIESFTLIPINANGLKLGLVGILSREPKHFTPELLRLLTAIADSVGSLLDNGRLYREKNFELQQRHLTEKVLGYSEASTHALLESTSQGIVFANERGKIMQVNAGTLNMFGYNREELIGQPVEMLLPEDLRNIHTVHRGTYFSDPNTRPMGHGRDLSGRRKDGTCFPAEIGLSFIQQGGRRQALAFIVDVTVRKEAEEAQRRWAEENSVMVQIGQIINSSLSIDDVFGRLGDEIKKLIPWDRMDLSILDQESATEFPKWESGTAVPNFRQMDQVSITGTLTTEVLSRRSPVLFEASAESDVSSRFSALMPCFRVGIRSFLAAPLINRDLVIGVVQFQSKAYGIYTDRYLDLAQRVCSQISGAVANAQLYSELIEDYKWRGS